MADLSVSEVAQRLGVGEARVRQLLRSGTIAGRRLGRDWAVPVEGVVAANSRPTGPGRPLAPQRAWGLLDLLDGGRAPWLTSVARSQVRARAVALAGCDPAAWTKALRGREERMAVAGHRSAVSRLLGTDGVWAAGPGNAGSVAADLVVLNAVPEVYVSAEHWDRLACSLHLTARSGQPDVWVRVPHQLWPFGSSGPGRAAVAASLLDGEWRAARAGAEILNDLAAMAER